MNPYNTLDQSAQQSDTIEFVPPAEDVVRLVQLSIWSNRLDRRHAPGGELPMATSAKRVDT